MEEIMKTEKPLAPDTGTSSAELWKMMGRREAFSLVAGRCSAADVESLRRIKEGKLYEPLGCTWAEFCLRHLNVSRRKVDLEIGYLKHHGPEFFTLRQLAHISVREYAQIAGHVSEAGVHVDDAVVPLLPENREQLTGALKTLLERIGSAAPALAPPEFESVLQRFRAATQGLRSFEGDLSGTQLRSLGMEIAEAISAAGDRGLVLEPQ